MESVKQVIDNLQELDFATRLKAYSAGYLPNGRKAEPNAVAREAMERELDQERPPALEATGAKIFNLAMKRRGLKVEQNLGCELPVCVANRKDVTGTSIRFRDDRALEWILERGAESLLPGPDHYPYWLWFLDRCQAAAEAGWVKPPRIELSPPEIFDLFGAPRGGKRQGHSGSRYDALDQGFSRFSKLIVSKHTAFHQHGTIYTGRATLGTLCYYSSWRTKPKEGQQVMEFAKGYIVPGDLLWASIRSGYLKSIPLESLKGLDYVGQRLLVYISKHCRKGGEFAIGADKLLPKIPVHWRDSHLRTRLEPRHEALAKVDFLADAKIEGRGANKLITYRRT